MYSEMAQYYDRIYSFKDYAAESATLVAFIETHRASSGKRLLDVACGTGRHLEFLAADYQVEGLDLCDELLDVARSRNPGVRFHRGDMRTFELPDRFDAITCLFSSIGYMTTLDDLNQAIATMARHLAPGGVLLVEPWISPADWKAGSVHGLLVDEPELKIARVCTSLTRERLSVMDMHHLVGTPEGTFHFVEHHEMLLATDAELAAAFAAAGLATVVDAEGLTGRGLYMGVRPNG